MSKQKYQKEKILYLFLDDVIQLTIDKEKDRITISQPKGKVISGGSYLQFKKQMEKIII